MIKTVCKCTKFALIHRYFSIFFYSLFLATPTPSLVSLPAICLPKEESALKLTESKPISIKNNIYLKISLLISILICIESFDIAKVILAGNVKAVPKIEPKALGFWSWI